MSSVNVGKVFRFAVVAVVTVRIKPPTLCLVSGGMLKFIIFILCELSRLWQRATLYTLEPFGLVVYKIEQTGKCDAFNILLLGGKKLHRIVGKPIQ